MTSIFDVTGARFFVPLTSKNKIIYMDTIFFLNDLINELFEDDSNDKNNIIEKLTDNLNDKLYVKLYKEDSDGEEELIDNKAKAIILINRLLEYGWLVEEVIGNGRKALDFTGHSYSFIKVIKDLIENRKPQYTSYVRTIRNILDRGFDYSRMDDLETIDESLVNFTTALRSLRSSIQGYYKNITKNKTSVDLASLLDEFTGEYKEYFFDSSYFNLKIVDNLDFEIPRINEELENLFSDFLKMETLTKARIEPKKYKDYDLADKYIRETKKRIKTNLRMIPSIMEMIDSKNEKYVTRTVSVIIHMISRGEDIEGILNRLIDFVKKDEVQDSIFSLFSMTHYTFDALSTKSKKKSIKSVPQMMALDLEVSDEVKERTLILLKEDRKYNMHAVNEFVLKFLNGKKKNISELDLDTKFEFIMMVSIMIFSKLPNAIYEIELTNDRVVKNGIKFNDFSLIEKGGASYE